MGYDIIDTQLGDYYEKNCTLEFAKDLAWRRQEEWVYDDSPKYYKENLEKLHEIENMTEEKDIAEVLDWYDYELVKHEE